MFGRIVSTAPGVIAILAGLYLLTTQTLADNSYLEMIGQGMGAYLLARGFHMIATLRRQDELVSIGRKQLEAQAHDHVSRTVISAPPATSQ